MEKWVIWEYNTKVSIPKILIFLYNSNRTKK